MVQQKGLMNKEILVFKSIAKNMKNDIQVFQKNDIDSKYIQLAISNNLNELSEYSSYLLGNLDLGIIEIEKNIYALILFYKIDLKLNRR